MFLAEFLETPAFAAASLIVIASGLRRLASAIKPGRVSVLKPQRRYIASMTIFLRFQQCGLRFSVCFFVWRTLLGLGTRPRRYLSSQRVPLPISLLLSPTGGTSMLAIPRIPVLYLTLLTSPLGIFIVCFKND